MYHIEKGDSYIEPANITGQLIINDLTKVLTSTPTLNVVQDTNQVDFGLFKGKHIRISQYTNIGAVVLGDWYSPYCKQGMTNFDVIESYVDDFTKWRIENTGVTSTQKKIVIAAGTELKYSVAYKCFIGCHGDILLFNRTLTEYEISWVKNNMMCSKQQEPDIDL